MTQKMRFAISTELFKEEKQYRIYQNIARMGFRYVSIHLNEEAQKDDIVAAHKDFRQLGLKCVQVTSERLPKSFMDEKHMEQAIEEVNGLCEIADLYECPLIGLTAGSFRGKKEEHIESAAKFISQACDIAKESGLTVALDVLPKKNQIIKTWAEMTEFFEKVDKDNLTLNANTALFHHLSVSDDDLAFLGSKCTILEIMDLEDDNWIDTANIGEGIVDIKSWVSKALPYVSGSNFTTALAMFTTDSEDEITLALDYLESILPDLKL